MIPSAKRIPALPANQQVQWQTQSGGTSVELVDLITDLIIVILKRCFYVQSGPQILAALPVTRCTNRGEACHHLHACAV